MEDDRIAVVEGTPFGEHKRTTQTVALKGAKLLAPVDNPTYYAIGRNYQGHVEGRVRAGSPMPPKPWAWWRSASALTGTSAPLHTNGDEAVAKRRRALRHALAEYELRTHTIVPNRPLGEILLS